MSIPRKTSWVFFQKKRPKLRSFYHRGSQFWSYPRGWWPGPARSCRRRRWRWCSWRRPRQCRSGAGNFVVTANFGWKDVLLVTLYADAFQWRWESTILWLLLFVTLHPQRWNWIVYVIIKYNYFGLLCCICMVKYWLCAELSRTSP